MATRPPLTTDERVRPLSAWWDTQGPLLDDDAIREVYSYADSGCMTERRKARELARKSS